MKYQEIKETDKAYFAGLFDGEGTVRVAKNNSENRKNTSYILEVSFTLTYASILYKIKDMFGGNVYEINMSKQSEYPSVYKGKNAGCYNPEKWKQQYHYKVRSKEAWTFLKIIEPYCEEKKEQVRVGIEFFNGKRGKSGCELSNQQIERGKYYYKKLQELKHSENNISENKVFIDKQTKIDIFAEE